jgi:hypothetical protein
MGTKLRVPARPIPTRFEGGLEPAAARARLGRAGLPRRRVGRPIVTDNGCRKSAAGRGNGTDFATLERRDPLIGEAPNFLAAWAQYCSDGEGLEAATDRLASFSALGGGQVAGRRQPRLRRLDLALPLPWRRSRAMLHGHSAPQDRFHRLHQGAIEEIAAS